MKVTHNINLLYTELKPSTVCDGVGVFAIKNIPAGTDVFADGRKDTLCLWDAITDNDVRKIIERLCHSNKDGFYISDHPVNFGMSYYINHHSNPNVAYDKNNDTFYTIKPISKGQELFGSYKEEEQDWLI